MNSPVKLDSPKPINDFFIVGIGASAGGLEAIEEFFKESSSTSGMAFILIQHLSDQYKSFMPELLSRHTSMEIIRAENGMEIKPNCIYLNPPRTEVTVKGGRLLVTSSNPKQNLFFPIDALFSSLATMKKEKAIGVILSGKGTDGTKGIKAIHESGGIILTQKKETAKFQDMPRSAEETGIVNYILSPIEMAKFISKYNTYKKIELEEDELTKIYKLVKDKCNIDFSLYKQNSVLRRIERRVNLFHSTCLTLKDYRNYLENNPSEIVKLQHDMLIGVTHFFRDPDAFHLIKKEVLPQIFQQKRKDQEKDIRIWVAGCSTGEEAYSVAIMFKEYMDDIQEDFNIRIFATDLDNNSIKIAMQGVYPDSIVSSLSNKRLSKYFDQQDRSYKVKKEIRDMIIFAPHNIAKDSPFVHLDFISCRNMMIYFQPELQKKVLSLFHFSLNKNGFLFLGPSETIGKLSNLYEVIHSKWKIFRYVDSSEWDMANTFNVSKYAKKESTFPEIDLYQQYMDSKNKTTLDTMYHKIIERYTTPCLIVNEQDDILLSGGNVRQYFKIQKSLKSSNLYKLVQTDLSIAVGTALKKVRSENKEVHYPSISIKHRDQKKDISLTAKPFLMENQKELIIILINEVTTTENLTQPYERIPTHRDKDLNQQIIDLEHELYYTQQDLQTTIEELETSNEELQSTNEELIAANEELQSTNEELQSVNEELMNVNNEHEQKIYELTALTNDMDNLLISTNIATIFLDMELRIKRFTPEVTKVVNLIDMDIGRPFFHISNNLKYDDIIEDATKVLDTATKIERQVRDKTGNWYNVKIMPYRTSENFIRGIVITFMDITEIKKANEDLKITSFALEQSPANILISNHEGTIEYANQQFQETFGFLTKEILKSNIKDFYNNMGSDIPFAKIWNVIMQGKQWSGELKVKDIEGNEKWESVSFTPIVDELGQQIQVLRIAEDITLRKNAENLLKDSEILAALGQLAAGIAHEIRNPLTSLKGFLQLMDQDQSYNTTYGTVMISEFERIESIVSELLLLARPQDVKYDFCNLSKIIEEVSILLETQANLKSIVLKTDTSTTLPEIRCVTNEIKQVIINVVKNAIEAISNGGQIHLSTEVEYNDTLKITISDTGDGIPKDRLKKIGQPFYTTKEKGTGLGLMVSLKIIENHGGKMYFESEIGKGTTVTIRLPIY
ncbi:MAG: PAS domain-containing protein [Bacillaceae bacterium]|nr:PAS domain-containing protein [Bacillaceae bacterium]